jgi:hypothetical protein
MNKSIVFPLTVAASLVASLAGSVLSIQTSVAAGGPVRNFSASISPTTSNTSQAQSYTATFTNSAGSTEDIKSATLAVPTGWSVNSGSLVLGGGASSGWAVELAGTLIKASKNSGGGSGIVPGSSFTITFTATAPATAGTGTWTARAFKNNSFTTGGGGEFDQTNSEPTVTVSVPMENTAPLCSDGLDNDGDSLVDLADPNCAAFIPPENTEEACTDGVDNDLDGQTDLADSDCAAFVPVDVCPNIPENQETMPEGYELVEGECVVIPPPVVDVCPNMEGNQETLPEGYELVEGECVEVTPEPVDVCPNLPENQETIPPGYEMSGEDCVEIPPPPVEPVTGSITVCKVIADAVGGLVTASSETDVPAGLFTISGITPAVTSEEAPVGVIGSAGFTTPLTWNTNLFGEDSVLDAQCIGFSGLTLGGYYYGEESVSPNDGTWLAPKYNDQFTVDVMDITDSFLYDSNLFDGNAENDESREANADGHIVLSEGRPDRTLVVVNQFTNDEGNGGEGEGEGDGVENTEELCADETDNDNDQLIDAEDPDCEQFQSGGDDEEGGEQSSPQSGGGGGGGLYLEVGDRCTNGYDDDGNGLTDAADPKCVPANGQGAVAGATTETPAGEVLGATTCEALLTDYLRMGKKNDPEQVKKLQDFLNLHMGANLPLTGFFGSLTDAAVKQFQLKYWDEVLSPWVPHGFPNDKEPSGYVYKTTLRKINNLFCDSLNLPLPQLP